MRKPDDNTFCRGNGYCVNAVRVPGYHLPVMLHVIILWKRLFLMLLAIPAILVLHAQQKPADLPFKPAVYNEFIENKGQITDQFQQPNTAVKYLLHTNGMNVQLKKNSFSYDTYEVLPDNIVTTAKPLAGAKWLPGKSTAVHFHRVDIQFAGSNPSPLMLAEVQQPADALFYTNPAAGKITAHYFNRIIYKDLYPGIDLVFTSGNPQSPGFEYYFIVEPGADAGLIRLQYQGAATELDSNHIVIHLAGRDMKEVIPASFIAGNYSTDLISLKRQSTVNVSYKNYGSNSYGFKLPVYNRAKTLIIDPVPDLVWGTYYGNTLNDWAYCMAKSPDGNILVAGSSVNPNVATAGVYQSDYAGSEDGLFGKFSASGQPLWMSYYGGDKIESIYGICTDNTGNIFIAGITDSQTGIATPGSYQPAHGDALFGRDGFLAKFTTDGSRLWGSYFGGGQADAIQAIQCDASGNVFIAGWTNSTTGIATRNAYQTAYGSDPNPQHAGDGFLARFNNDGALDWATYYGGVYLDRFYGLAIDNKGNIYAAGIAYSPAGIASQGAYQTYFGGGYDDAMIVKFSNAGKRLWASYYGGEKEDYAETVACDKQNNVIIGGMSISQYNIATAGAAQTLYGGGARDGFLAKFTENGARLWGSYYGGNGEDFIHGISCDPEDNIIIAGSSYSTDNIATNAVYQPTGPAYTGDFTAFVAKLDKSCKRAWGTYYGYGGLNAGYTSAAVTDSSGNIFVCGVTMASSGVSTCDAFQKTLGGSQDMFVAMFSETMSALAMAVSIKTNSSGAVCAGTPVSFVAATKNIPPNPFYQWKVNSVNTGNNSAVFTSSSLNNADTVTCTVTSNSSCNNLPVISNRIVIAFGPSFIPSVTIVTGSSGSICSGTPVQFNALAVNGGSTPVYRWQVNGIDKGNNGAVFNSSSLANGDVISCVLTNAQSCNAVTNAISNTIVMSVNAGVYPSVRINSSADSICAGQLVTFSASAANAGNSAAYEWRVNGLLTGTGLTYTSSKLSATDTVLCLLKPGANICGATATIASNKISIPVNPVPVITIQPVNPFILKGDTLQLTAGSSTDIVQFAWTPVQDISDAAAARPKIWPAVTGTYSLEAVSAKGCVVHQSIKVGVLAGLAVPNAFTPNGDGLNDTWKIKGLERYTGCRVMVFNRYGQLVYQSAGYAIPWNGTFRNQPLEPGSFAFVIDLHNGTKPITGTITIIR